MKTYSTPNSPIRVTSKDALIIVDMQNDFLSGGNLAVKDGDTIISGINYLGKTFFQDCQIIFTQDWHPSDHKSFASTHPGKKPFDEFSSTGLGPVLWPDHCVQGSRGAMFSSEINHNLATMILRKGYHKHLDSYSAFLENDKKTRTGLTEFLKAFEVTRLFICGLALDFCVKYTALDAQNFGFDTYIVLDLTKPVITEKSVINENIVDLKSNNVHLVTSDQFNQDN